MGKSVARPLRILAAPLVVAMLVFGVWITGGVITDDFKTSVALTAVWFMLAGAACAATAYRLRPVRIPVIAAYLLTAVVVGGYLGWSTLHDQVVHERVVVGTPAKLVEAPAGRASAAPVPADNPAPARPVGPVQLAAGAFRSGEHTTTGSAKIVRLTSGHLVLTLTGFRTSPGPDLRVRLVPAHADRGDAPGNRDLGGLKGNIGDQQYDVPARAPVVQASVVIWCRAFSATFGTADLAPS